MTSCHEDSENDIHKQDQTHVALVGNPNVGKTVIFNALTGTNQRVGNFPGVTVTRKHGSFNYKEIINTEIVDLPGSYSLDSTSPAEILTREWIITNEPDLIINVIDSSNLKRNLFLTLTLIDLQIPMIIILNMVDVAKGKGISVDGKNLSKKLQIPVLNLKATNRAYNEILKSFVAENLRKLPDIPTIPKYGSKFSEIVVDLTKSLREINMIKSEFLATKLIEGDKQILSLYEKQLTTPSSEILQAKLVTVYRNLDVFNLDPELLVNKERTKIVENLAKDVLKRDQSLNRTLTNQLDEVLTHKWLGIPIFFLILWITFQITFQVATPFMELIDIAFTIPTIIVETLFVNYPLVVSLLNDGIIAGVGGILVFLPNIFILFILISVLEDSGYLARVSHMMDKVMVQLGMEGRSFVPMLVGFGCNVPAVMATRNIAGKKERIQTILISPFMSCSARLPVYILFTGIFFTSIASEVILLLYLTGILVAILVAFIFNKTLPTFKGKSTPLILEMPSYLRPTLTSVIKNAKTRSYNFINKVGTIILLASIIIWLMSHLVLNPFSLQADTSQIIDKTLIGLIGNILSPLFAPLNLNWKLIVGLIFGLIAKEIVVATLGILYVGLSQGDTVLSEALMNDPTITPLIAFSFLVFVLLYTPCFAALGAIKSETNSKKWAIFVFIYTFIVALIVSSSIFTVGRFIGLQ